MSLEQQFEILSTLAQNSFGRIYKARDVADNRIVALKTLSMIHCDEHAVRRFWREAQSMAFCNLPEIMPVYQVGQLEDTLFLTMEFADGGSLAQRLDRPWTPVGAAQLVKTLAEAVHFCHQRGIIHRGIKPGHILFDGDGRPKLSGFGQYRHVEMDDTDANTSATDIADLGRLLLDLLTSHQREDSGSATEPRFPAEALPDTVPAPLKTVYLKSIGNHSTGAYASAAELAEDLRRFVVRGSTSLVGRGLRSFGRGLHRWFSD